MNRKVLYVDDDILNTEFFRISFRDNFEVLTSTVPERALEIFEKEEPSVLIADYRMPGINGIELIKKAREIHPQCSFILLSGLMEANMEELDLFAYISKPYQRDSVEDIIEKAIDLFHKTPAQVS